MADNPLVSVLMTAYIREAFIGEAIESVLGSTHSNFELIVVDDCSTDKTVKIAQKYAAKDNRIKVFVNEKNLGDYPNRNQAASHAKGKYIKYLDSDDIIYPHGLEVMVNAMEQFPEVGFGLASDPENQRPYPVCIEPEQIYSEHFNSYGHFNRAPGSSIIKRETFEKIGGFSGERMVGDLDLWLKLGRQFNMVKFPFGLYWNRIHHGQEFKSDYARKIYPKRTKEILLDALNHENCPLSEQAKKDAISKVQRPVTYKFKQKISRHF